MPPWQGKRPITIVSAYMNANGCPDLTLNQIEVTHDEAENGIHFYLVEADLLEAGFEEPFVHFDEFDGPAFLHSSVRQYLGLATESPYSCILVAPEEN
jgi:hypothetical protein